MEVLKIRGESRNTFGKKATKQVRQEGGIPAVLYGKNDSYHFSTNLNDVRHLVYTPDFKMAEVELGDETHKAILKDIQFHPVTDEILHIDFLKLYDDVKVKVEIPVHFKGDSPGVRAGGQLMPSLRKIEVLSVPGKIVHEFMVDISEVELGETIRVKDLEVEEGMEILTSPNSPLASIKVPRIVLDIEEEEEEEEGEEGAVPAEGEEGAAAPPAEGESKE